MDRRSESESDSDETSNIPGFSSISVDSKSTSTKDVSIARRTRSTVESETSNAARRRGSTEQLESGKASSASGAKSPGKRSRTAPSSGNRKSPRLNPPSGSSSALPSQSRSSALPGPSKSSSSSALPGPTKSSSSSALPGPSKSSSSSALPGPTKSSSASSFLSQSDIKSLEDPLQKVSDVIKNSMHLESGEHTRRSSGTRRRRSSLCSKKSPSIADSHASTSSYAQRVNHQIIGIVGKQGTGRNHLAACLARTYDGDRHVYQRESPNNKFSVVVVDTDTLSLGNPGAFAFVDAVIFLYAIDDPDSLYSLREWNYMFRQMRPTLLWLYLVGNKMDLRLDVRYDPSSFMTTLEGEDVKQEFCVQMFAECSALYFLETIPIEEAILASVLPSIYGGSKLCPSKSVDVDEMTGLIIGDKGTGRNTLAYRLTNLDGEGPQLRRKRRVPCPSRNQDVSLTVYVVPTDTYDEWGPEDRFWDDFNTNIDFLILLFRLDDKQSLYNATAKWALVSSRIVDSGSSPLLLLVGNKTERRSEADPDMIISSDSGKEAARSIKFINERRIPNYYECSAFLAQNTTRLQQAIICRRLGGDDTFH